MGDDNVVDISRAQTVDEAKAALERAKAERTRLCSQAIEALLKEHGCQLTAIMTIGHGVMPRAEVQLVATA